MAGELSSWGTLALKIALFITLRKVGMEWYPLKVYHALAPSLTARKGTELLKLLLL